MSTEQQRQHRMVQKRNRIVENLTNRKVRKGNGTHKNHKHPMIDLKGRLSPDAYPEITF